jgi:hypothetical protein
MNVHQRGIAGRHLYLEYAYVLIFQREVMTRLGGDFHLGSALRNQSDGAKNKRSDCKTTFHESRF